MSAFRSRRSTGSLIQMPKTAGSVAQFLARAWLVVGVCAVFGMPAVASATEDQVQHETGFYYTVEKGDTLWDISERFSDAPQLWPDLWEKNQQIGNPHLIYPGQQLRLYQKSGTRDLEPRAALPEPEPPHYLFNFMDHVGFIKTEPLPIAGEVVQAEGVGDLLGEGDIIYIRQEGQTPMVPGGRYKAYRRQNPVENLDVKNRYGIQYLPTGVVEVIAEQDGFTTARIVQSYNIMLIGDVLLPYEKQPEKIYYSPSPEGIAGSIIGTQFHDTIIGDKTVVFIDKGETAGVKPGQLYTVVFREKLPRSPNRPWKYQLLPTSEIGSLLVLHSEKENATALVTQSRRTILPGYQFQTPADQ